MNVPHPAAFQDKISIKQLRRSWFILFLKIVNLSVYILFFRYMFFFQVPIIPQLLLEANDFAMLGASFSKKPMGLINKDNMTSDDVEVFKYTFSQKGKYMNYLMFVYEFVFFFY
jgi:hypothetical protein